MTQRFYRPMLIAALEKPCLIYPARDESRLETVLPRDKPGIVESFVEQTAKAHEKLLKQAAYFITIPWNSGETPLLDIWAFTMENISESGPLVTAYTFNADDVVKDLGTASGDGLVLLGYEEALRRQHDSLESYVHDVSRPSFLPSTCRADEAYYVLQAPIA